MFDFFTFTYNDYIFHSDYLFLVLLSFILLITSQTKYLSYDSLSKKEKLFSNFFRFGSIFFIIGIPLQIIYILFKNIGRSIKNIIGIVVLNFFLLFSLLGIDGVVTNFYFKEMLSEDNISQEVEVKIRDDIALLKRPGDDVTLSDSLSTEYKELVRRYMTEQVTWRYLSHLKDRINFLGSWYGYFSSDFTREKNELLLDSQYQVVYGLVNKSGTSYSIERSRIRNEKTDLLSKNGVYITSGSIHPLFKLGNDLYVTLYNKDTETFDLVNFSKNKAILKDIGVLPSPSFIIYDNSFLLAVITSGNQYKYFKITSDSQLEEYYPSRYKREIGSYFTFKNKLELGNLYNNYLTSTDQIILEKLDQNKISLFIRDEEKKGYILKQ